MLTSDSSSASETAGRVRALELALAVPGIVLIAIAIALLTAMAAGDDRLWRTERLTLPEAAALRDDAEVVLLIGKGADPNKAGVIRARFLTGDPVVLTPLEAAVGARREQMVMLLLDHGTTLDLATWTRLKCFAGRVDAPAVEAVLDARRPEGAVIDCKGVDTPW